MLEIIFEKDIYTTGRGKILVVDLAKNNITLKDLVIGSDIKANGDLYKVSHLEYRGSTYGDTYKVDNLVGVGVRQLEIDKKEV